MESMKHFASTKYNVSVITIFFFFSTNILYTVCYIGTTSEQQQSILHIYIIILYLCCEHLSQSVYNSVQQNISDQCFLSG